MKEFIVIYGNSGLSLMENLKMENVIEYRTSKQISSILHWYRCDITDIENIQQLNIDAIVNPANPSLMGENNSDNMLRCHRGDVVITEG